jgi:predicted MFS family arabinose efflux permease
VPNRRALQRNLVLYRLFSAVVHTPVMIPVLVLFLQENGLSIADIFLLQSLFALAVVVLEVPTGMVADRLGKRTSLVASTAAVVAGFGLYAISSGFYGFLGAELAIALGMSLLSGADSALLYDTLKGLGREAEYTRFEGRTRSLQLAVMALSTLGGGALGEISLRATLWASALGPLLALGVALLMVEAAPPERLGSIRAGVVAYRGLIVDSSRFVWRHQQVRWHMAVYAVVGGGLMWLLWLYQPYMELVGLPVWAFGVAFAVFNLFSAGVSRFAHRIDALGPRRAVVVLTVLMVVPLLCLASVVGLFSPLFIVGHQAARALFRPILSGRILEHTYADKRATVLSIASMGARLFFGLSAPFIGYATQELGLLSSLWVQAALLFLSLTGLLLCWPLIGPKFHRVKPEVRTRA